MPYAAYPSLVEITGTATALSSEACALVSGKIYQVTDAAKRVLDPDTAIVVKDDGVEVAAGSYTVNYMFGKITFAAAYTPTTPITIFSGKYLPRLEIGVAKEYSIDDETELPDTTVFSSSPVEQCIPTTRDVTGTLRRLDAGQIDYDTGGGSVRLMDLLITPTRKVLSIALGSSGTIFRALVGFSADDISMGVKGVIEGTAKWSLWRSIATTIDGGSVAAYNYSED
jgi:hypothetical protein